MRLKLAFGVTLAYMVAEAVGGWLTNSLALIADAGHMLIDVASLSLTLFAIWFGKRPATPIKTYGYYRLEILSAFVNGIALVLVSIWIMYEAVRRWSAPPNIAGMELTLIAAGGFIVNLLSAYLLRKHHQHDLNIRGARLHVIGDLLVSATTIFAGALIVVFGWLWADAVCSFVISLIIIASARSLVLDSINVLMEGTPRHLDHGEIQATILHTDGVTGAHDLHIWSISSGMDALSVHIQHEKQFSQPKLLVDLRDKLQRQFGISHLTIQFESMEHGTDAIYQCDGGIHCFEPER